MNTHIDQLAEWWENAEEVESGTVAREGDHIITRKHSSPHYPDAVTYVARLLGKGEEYAIAAPYTRILHRAPKPKPAWHDAVAVMARCPNAPEGHREPFIRSEATPDVWIGEGGYGCTDDLRDVTPLIEAKVTDEARDRVWDELVHHGLIDPQKHRPSQGWAADVVHATLGLETA